MDAWMVFQFEERAENEIKAGGSIEINYRIPYISIKLSDGNEYFFQDFEAQELLDEVPDVISSEDYILAIAQTF